MSQYVLIIGAASDIGRSLAYEYASGGHNLYLAARNCSRLQRDADDLSVRHQTDIRLLDLDVLAYDTHKTFFSRLDPFPDIVISVAGYLGDQKKAEQDPAEARKIMETNYNGCVSLLTIAAGEMEKRKHGLIVGISSVAGDRGRASNAFYGSAKAGFTAYLSGLRNRMTKHGVHVMTVKPGFVDTKMTKEMQLPGLLTAQTGQVARKIAVAGRKKRNVLYVLGIWRLLMTVIGLIPEAVFKKMKL